MMSISEDTCVYDGLPATRRVIRFNDKQKMADLTRPTDRSFSKPVGGQVKLGKIFVFESIR